MRVCRGWQDVLDRDACIADRFTRLQPFEEGLILTLFRFAWIPFVCIHRPIIVMLIFRTLGSIGLLLVNHESWDGKKFRHYLSLIVDLYTIFWLVILLYLYSLIYLFISNSKNTIYYIKTNICIYFILFIALYRLYEMWAFIGGLHAQKKYHTINTTRAIVNTFWHYAEAIVCFAIIYIFLSYAFGDTFSPNYKQNQFISSILHEWITPLYFSMISISTVGFGDFSPQTCAGKIFVMLQIIYGIFLFVVVLQRAMASEKAPTKQDVELRANQIWVSEGRPEGKHRNHWSRAKEELGVPCDNDI